MAFFYQKFIFSLFIFSLLVFTGCGQPKSSVTFSVQGFAKDSSGKISKDGSFRNKCCDFRIVPSQVWVVLGDIHLQKAAPSEDPKVFSSLQPLLSPGQSLPASMIGQAGKFPGLWAINITPGTAPFKFPAGQVEVGNWKGIQMRLAPAVSGVKGISDPIREKTLLIKGTAEKGKIFCGFSAKLSFEQGMARNFDFRMTRETAYNHKILINYARWLDDINFEDLCVNSKQTIQINNTSHQQLGTKIKSTLPKTIELQIDSSISP